MQKRGDNLVSFFCRHLLGLCVSYRHTATEDGDTRPRFAVCSGTLVIIQDRLFFLTAGHVLEDLDRLRKCDKVAIENVVLADTFGDRRISDLPVPFDLKGAELFYINDEAAGLDFGVIPIGIHHTRLLIKNRMIALSEKNWSDEVPTQFDGYAMLGFPAEFASERVSISGDAIVEAVMLGVERLDPSQTENNGTNYPQFVGRVRSQLPVNSLKGMSGGLIIGVKKEPTTRYWVIGIQSSWNPKTRIVHACPVSVFGKLVAELEMPNHPEQAFG